MSGLETDHVISGPMRWLKICFTGRGPTYKHTYRHRNSMSNKFQRAQSVKIKMCGGNDGGKIHFLGRGEYLVIVKFLDFFPEFH